jgi:hypothetical protein
MRDVHVVYYEIFRFHGNTLEELKGKGERKTPLLQSLLTHTEVYDRK